MTASLHKPASRYVGHGAIMFAGNAVKCATCGPTTPERGRSVSRRELGTRKRKLRRICCNSAAIYSVATWARRAPGATSLIGPYQRRARTVCLQGHATRRQAGRSVRHLSVNRSSASQTVRRAVNCTVLRLACSPSMPYLLLRLIIK